LGYKELKICLGIEFEIEIEIPFIYKTIGYARSLRLHPASLGASLRSAA